MSDQASERDPKTLAQVTFATPDSLLDVVEIGKRYASDVADVIRTLLDAVRPERPDWRICELGFGTGWLLEEMLAAFPDVELFGLDMSPGMTSRTRDLLGRRVALVSGDMERLPFEEASFDVVVTCWTLYFMRDIDAALAEIKRTLRPGGRLVVAANAPDHMQEFDDLALGARRAVLGHEEESDIFARFNLESGAPYVRRQFVRVDLREWHGWLMLPDTAPMLRLWDLWRTPDLAGEAGDRVRAEFARRAEAWAARAGEIRIRRHGGAFVGHTEP